MWSCLNYLVDNIYCNIYNLLYTFSNISLFHERERTPSPAWINKYINWCNEITHQLSNVNDAVVQVTDREWWRSASTPHFTGSVITYPWQDQTLRIRGLGNIWYISSKFENTTECWYMHSPFNWPICSGTFQSPARWHNLRPLLKFHGQLNH